jgi:murein DD-endopeptidase MepM/ murein hydrolase activator NlpD
MDNGIITMIHRLFSEPLTSNNSVALDLSATNTELNASIYGETAAFCNYITTKLAGKIGYGGYLEYRVVYESHENFATDAADFRNIHLGMDFWTTAGTAVFAPLDGVVHSFQINPGSGNYGPTIILHHPSENLYSLYGHLATEDLVSLKVGDEVAAGQRLCQLGKPEENGGWPPHLHFQLIYDMQTWKGDYPGVCSQRDAAFYAQNCPDPALQR